jgi:hypothetical protein
MRHEKFSEFNADGLRCSSRGAAHLKRVHPTTSPSPQTPIAVLARLRVSGRSPPCIRSSADGGGGTSGGGKTTAIRQLVGRRVRALRVADHRAAA